MSATRTLLIGACAVYGTTALLGVGLASGLWRNREHRWIHHAGYIAVVALTSAGVVSGLGSDRARAAIAAGALVPLAVLPRISTRSRRHPVVALTVAPWLLAAILRRRR